MIILENEQDGVYDICPNCGGEISEYDCSECGFSSLALGSGEYETPEGNITICTEDEAIERGYMGLCACGNLITWWEIEDHGKCIECWHKENHIDKSI